MPALTEDLSQTEMIEDNEVHEYGSGETVEPGLYLDVENGAMIEVREPDALPEGVRIVTYARRFRKMEEKEVSHAA